MEMRRSLQISEKHGRHWRYVYVLHFNPLRQQIIQFEPLPDSDDEDSEDDFSDPGDEENSEISEEDVDTEAEDDDEDGPRLSRGKRKPTDGNGKARKRRKVDKPVRVL